MGHCGRPLLCGKVLWKALLVRHSCGTLTHDTLVGHSCTALLWEHTLVGHSSGAVLLPPKAMRQVSKTSVSYETSSKTYSSSLQNERFVRDFLQKSHETSSKTHTSSLQNKRFVRNLLQLIRHRTRFYPQTPRVTREPFATHSGKRNKTLGSSPNPLYI